MSPAPPRAPAEPRTVGAMQRIVGLIATAIAVQMGGLSLIDAQVSPGPLSRAHRDLDAPLKCLQCHGAAREAMEGKCLVCHADIGWLMERGRGLHGASQEKKCAICHPEHAGVDFALIEWPDGSASAFDHKRAGFPLVGKHATLECRQCHQQKHITAALAGLGSHPDPARRWTGLDPQCVSCHRDDDIHRGALGGDCASCHGQQRWKPAATFDHARTAYPLTGKHATVACAACHDAARLDLPRDPQGHRVPLYKPLPHQECSACHTDPHQARLGPNCAQCHATSGFHDVAQKVFNHDVTRFPLRGGHRSATCDQCHNPKTAWGRRPAFDACSGCHADPHAGQATLAGRKVDCASCHDVSSWQSSTFDVARHAATRYALEGRHAQVACISCHLKNPTGFSEAALGRAGILMRPKHARCTDCHADAHAGQLSGRPDKGRCESCHDVFRFKPSTFTAADHETLELPLLGRHAQVPCSACHGPQRPDLSPLPNAERLGSAHVALRLEESACADCHQDPHGERFGPEASCRECHDATAFAPSLVDTAMHQRFSFRLEGAHPAVPCVVCHQELAPASPPRRVPALALAAQRVRRLEFTAKRSRCLDCHQTANPHGAQFADRPGGGDCGSCHEQDTFRAAKKFDHDRDAGFSLKGAHARVPCADCHASRLDRDGRYQVVYRPVPARCEDCHRAGPSGASQETRP